MLHKEIKTVKLNVKKYCQKISIRSSETSKFKKKNECRSIQFLINMWFAKFVCFLYSKEDRGWVTINREPWVCVNVANFRQVDHFTVWTTSCWQRASLTCIRNTIDGANQELLAFHRLVKGRWLWVMRL